MHDVMAGCKIARVQFGCIVISFVATTLLLRLIDLKEFESNPNPVSLAGHSGFLASPDSGIYSKDGAPRVIAQKHLENNEDHNFAPEAKGNARIAIIGAGGNIGSYLLTYLLSTGHDVYGFDRNVRLSNTSIVRLASSEMDSKLLSTFRSVVFLGGCTGRRSCDAMGPRQVYAENVQSVLDIALRMTSEQNLIVASTSAIAEGSGYRALNETDPLQPRLFDVYTQSMRDREIELAKVSAPGRPQIYALRFGTVVGVSQGQRTDLVIPSMFKAAYTTGILTVVHGESVRCFLWLPDLARAIARILGQGRRKTRNPVFSIFHLSSFTASTMKIATNIASLTGARVRAMDHDGPDSAGFSLDAGKFAREYGFTFRGTLSASLREMDVHVPDSVTAKGIHANVADDANESIACPVCGSHHTQLVLDLKSQPLANDFRANASAALAAQRYPIELVRCRTCSHMHLSRIIDRGSLFSSYLYRSGTSTTLRAYFSWLADKVILETGAASRGNVLEIACNDGSQLDQFLKRGWKTFGVDPAANLVPMALEKGHVVKTGFWGSSLEFPELPPPHSLHAILAQNVLAHVPSPVEFLKQCARAMGRQTLLYIQTSQCQMHQLGQFDTAYHEHISFFTGHSFLKAAALSGLHIVNFTLTPIHGTSCLVTLKLSSSSAASVPSSSMQQRLDSESAQGIHTDFFYTRYRSRAHQTRAWISSQLHTLMHSGYQIGAFGAAAKGMVLLHFLLAQTDRPFEVDFVVDDAKLKQKLFCPGTSIPVWPTADLGTIPPKQPLVLIILAWNFWDEISQKIQRELSARDEVLILLPFPHPRLFRLHTNTKVEETLIEMPYFPTAIPNPLRTQKRRRSVLLVSHFNNEELLLPYWIRHHAHMFDRAVMIDYNSTDASRQIISRLAPESWKVVDSDSGGIFGAVNCDKQVMRWENTYPDDWSIALTSTEFLIQANLRQSLFQQQPGDGRALIHAFPVLHIVGDDSSEQLLRFKSLPAQRNVYCQSWVHSASPRYMHINTASTHHYSTGRHSIIDQRGTPETMVKISSLVGSGFIMKFIWSPWPAILPRKLSVGTHIPEADRKRGFGLQHYSATSKEYLLKMHDSVLRGCSDGKALNNWVGRKSNHSVQHNTVSDAQSAVFGRTFHLSTVMDAGGEFGHRTRAADTLPRRKQ